MVGLLKSVPVQIQCRAGPESSRFLFPVDRVTPGKGHRDHFGQGNFSVFRVLSQEDPDSPLFKRLEVCAQTQG